MTWKGGYVLVVNKDPNIDYTLTHSIHTSASKSFRGCKLRWFWIFQEFWYPQTTAKPLEFGVAYHKALEYFYEPATWAQTRNDFTRRVMIEGAKDVFRQVCQEQLANYLKSDQGWLFSEEGKKDYDERIQLGTGMLEYQLNEVSPREDTNFTPVKVEIAFEVPITDPDTGEQLYCTCDTCWFRFLERYATIPEQGTGSFDGLPRNRWLGLPVTYGGRVDCLVQDQLGRYWIFDWKTAARLSSEDGRDDFLDLEDQITRYILALRAMLGLDIVGFVWHEQRKAVATEPEPLKVKRLGRRYSTSKSSVTTTADVYEKTVSENDVEAYERGLYDEFIDWLKERGGQYHFRHVITRSQLHLENAYRDLYSEACDQIDPNLRIYPNPGRFGCGGCAFQAPCVGRLRGEDITYTLATLYDKRKYHYWEDTKPSTDSKRGE
jgi:hypothetical protein